MGRTDFPNISVIETGYVLCYFLGDNDMIKEYAKRFADGKNLRLVSILSNECNSDDSQFADEILIGKSPEEFVNLIRNADFVLTDSFHGLAFSVINEKQFYIFYRNRTDVKQSRNSRIDNIVKIWGLEERLIKEPEKMIFKDDLIDYSIVTKKRNEFQRRIFKFSEKCFKKSRSRYFVWCQVYLIQRKIAVDVRLVSIFVLNH